MKEEFVHCWMCSSLCGLRNIDENISYSRVVVEIKPVKINSSYRDYMKMDRGHINYDRDG